MKDIIVSIFILFVALFIFNSATNGFKNFTAESQRRTSIEEKPVKLKNVKLVDQFGQRKSLSDYQGKYLIVDFIYTNCQLTCHALGAFFRDIQKRILQDSELEKVFLLSISFDMASDTISTIKRYQSRFTPTDKNWDLLLPNNKEGLGYLLETFGVIVIDDKQGGFIHNSAIHFITPEGKLYKIIDWNDINELTNEIKSIKKSSYGKI